MINATVLSIRVGPHEVYAQAAADTPLAPGDAVRLRFERFHVFDRAGLRLGTWPDTATPPRFGLDRVRGAD
jgi:hypothetical protein